MGQIPYSKNRALENHYFYFFMCMVCVPVYVYSCVGVQRCIHLERQGYVGCLPQSFSTITTEAVCLRWPQSSLTQLV